MNHLTELQTQLNELKKQILPELEPRYTTGYERVFQPCCNTYSERPYQILDNEVQINQIKSQNASIQSQIDNIQKEIDKIATTPLISNMPRSITSNTLNQFGESIGKPENQGLLLLAGLVAAAVVLN